MTAADRPPIIMVSSTVYGIEDSLDQIFAMLAGFGYEVWMSHKGTVPVDPSKSNFDNCLKAVENCDLFWGSSRRSTAAARKKAGCQSLIGKYCTLSNWKNCVGLAHIHVPFAQSSWSSFVSRGRNLERISCSREPR